MNLDKNMFDFDPSPRNQVYLNEKKGMLIDKNSACSRKLDFDHVVMNASTLYLHCKDAEVGNPRRRAS